MNSYFYFFCIALFSYFLFILYFTLILLFHFALIFPIRFRTYHLYSRIQIFIWVSTFFGSFIWFFYILQHYYPFIIIILIHEQLLELPKIKYYSIITFQFYYFQNIIRNLFNLSKTLQIKSVSNQSFFQCQSPFSICKIIRT